MFLVERFQRAVEGLGENDGIAVKKIDGRTYHIQDSLNGEGRYTIVVEFVGGVRSQNIGPTIRLASRVLTKFKDRGNISARMLEENTTPQIKLFAEGGDVGVGIDFRCPRDPSIEELKAGINGRLRALTLYLEERWEKFFQSHLLDGIDHSEFSLDHEEDANNEEKS